MRRPASPASTSTSIAGQACSWLRSVMEASFRTGPGRLRALDRCVHELDRVDNRRALAMPVQRGAELQQAAGVTRRDGIDGQRGDELRLAVPELRRRPWLHEVVDPGRAAADGALRDLDHLEAGDRRQERPRLGVYSLGMLEVAGVVVSHA